MVTFGLDISHHQDASLNLARCRQEAGVEFVFIKSTEGSSFVDSAFKANLSEARAAGLLVAAYHYVKSNATAAAQVANVVRTVPKDVPVIPDVEAGSGGVVLVRDFVSQLQAAGYHVPLTYLPRWYWQQIGSPSLVGLPSLWSSRYPDNAAGSIVAEYAAVPASYWNGYGGLGVTVLQFTSSARVPGYSGNLDANAYKGTRDQLAVVLGSQENDMQPTDLVLDPATGQPALDNFGHPFNYGAAWFYTNKAVWEVNEQVEALAAQMTELKTNIGATIGKSVADYLRENPPTVEAVDYDVLAARVVAEFKKEGN